MLSLPQLPRTLLFAATMLLIGLFASACGDGARPTLTGDRLVEVAIESPGSAVLQDSPAQDVSPETVDPLQDSESASTPPATTAEVPAEPSPAAGEVQLLTVQVLETLPHDPNALTQGLELYNGVFLESTGTYGESDVRRVDPATGQVLDLVPMADEYWGEGLTRVGDQIIQLTWRENEAFFMDATTLERTKQVRYEGEGWGLCYDGARLIMTDGEPELIFRDPVTFDEIGRITVTLNGEEVFNLNELECVDGVVWANIFQNNAIVRIDPATGLVTGLVDASTLQGPTESAGAVLNGIAWDESTQSFYVTGKLWPNMYRVNFILQDS